MFSLLNPPSAWKSKKVDLLKRLLVAQHVRQVLPATTGALAQSPAEYAIYKPVLIYFSLIDSLYAILFKVFNLFLRELPELLMLSFIIECSQ